MRIQSLIRCSLGLAIVTGVFAQTKPSNPSPSVPSAPSRGNSTTSIPTAPTSPDLSIQRPMLLTGKVQMDDGSPLTDSVLIQLVCRASPRNIGYTDRKGSFGVDLNDRNTNSMYLDASQASQPGYGATNGPGLNQNVPMGNAASTGTFGVRDFMGCDIRASLPGFRSDEIHLDARRSMDNPEIGTILLHRLGNVEGLTISATSAMAPKDAKKAFEKGRGDVQKGKPDDAQKEFEKAVTSYPKYAEAWYELGMIQSDKKDAAGARKSFGQALDADSKYVNPYLELAAMDMREQKWQDAADTSDRVLHLNPGDFPQAWYFNAFANYNLNKLDLAEKSAREGLNRDTMHKYPRLNRILAVILAQHQDLAGAAQQLRTYLQIAPNASDAEIVKKQLAELDKSINPEAQKQQ
jgi:hypothetical protein